MRRASFLLAPLSLLGSLVLAARPAQADDLVIVQESNWFPGTSGAANVSTQTLAVRGRRLRVRDASAGRSYYACLDDKMILEVNTVTREYVERPMDEFVKLRNERARRRADRVATARIFHARADEGGKRAIEQQLAGDGLTLSGEARALRLRFPDHVKSAVVMVDGKRRLVELEHWEIRQLGAIRPAFDLWLAPTLGKRADELLKFWRELAVFSDEVNAQLAEVQGLPVEYELIVDNGAGIGWKKLTGTIVGIGSETLDKAAFELPAGLQKLSNEEAPAELKCAVCAKAFKKGSGQFHRDPITNRTYELCSATCLAKHLGGGK